MKAMIFAAGTGTRLRPITDTVPKALVPIGGVPMLERLLLRLKEYGIRDIVVNVHHHAIQVIDFLRAKNNFGLDIAVSDESDRLLDTGGGIVRAAAFLRGDEPVLLHNADIYTNVDYRAMGEAHERTGADATLLVATRPTSRYLLFDRSARMHGWTDLRSGEVRPPSVDAKALQPLAFGGVHIISPALIDNIVEYARKGAVDRFSITSFYIDRCGERDFRGWLQPEGTVWHDIGTPEKLAAAEIAASNLIR